MRARTRRGIPRWFIAAVAMAVMTSVLSPPGLAQTAGMLSFQGLLKDPNGQPVNGPVTLQFRIYDAQTGGNLVDMDGNGAVDPNVGKDVKEVSATASSGIVSTKFGPVASKAFDGNARWLEVRMNGMGLSRTEVAAAPATAEQVNKPNSGAPAVSLDESQSIVFHGRNDNTEMTYSQIGCLDIASDREAGPGISLLYTGPDSQYPDATINVWDVQDANHNAALRWMDGDLHFTSYLTTPLVVEAIGAITITSPRAAGPAITLNYTGGTTPYPDAGININDEANPTHNCAMKWRDGVLEFANYYCTPLTVGRSTVSMQVVQITGGADLAEPFGVAKSKDEKQKIEPGMVVVIDPDNPGQLKLATEPYDRKVAGIISGANGLKPGMVMSGLGTEAVESHHKGTKTQSLVPPCLGGESVNPKPETRTPKPEPSTEHPVALTGRVWCWCDASYAPIAPGDRLTTSGTPGHAMKVTEETRTAGAVIGKAMTKLETGKGLVLVLVQPQ